jgi:hypothetical protein
MNQNGEGFQYLQQKFPWVSDAMIKKGIFISPHMKELINDTNFDEVLEGTENTVWEAFKLVLDNFLGNHKVPNYRQLVHQMLEAYQTMGRNVTENTLPSSSLAFLSKKPWRHQQQAW